MWAVVGVIIADIILTILITVSVFCLMAKYKRQKDPDSECCLPLLDECILFHTHIKMCFYLFKQGNKINRQ